MGIVFDGGAIYEKSSTNLVHPTNEYLLIELGLKRIEPLANVDNQHVKKKIFQVSTLAAGWSCDLDVLLKRGKKIVNRRKPIRRGQFKPQQSRYSFVG